MFTGLVVCRGWVTAVGRSRLIVRPEKRFASLKIGESISVDGVCLTVESVLSGGITFRLLAETRRVTTLGRLRAGESVNLERALRWGERLGGHWVLGHVDGRGRLAARTKRRAGGQTLTIEVPRALAPFCVPKGAIALDGVSLTLGAEPPSPCLPAGRGSSREPARVQVHLVAHTARVTTLGAKPVGAPLNIEVDAVAKLLFRQVV
ncbi:MAG: riboflavin synthase subunit alpha [Candidatus Omnitrophica bacterium CG11_big_fil_rev_8_21_14_0_20_64_10]|nr:MAG: riboflavin synthase subunit alpha [Candidatus Omnitrophica bacterium CG11_big_fil_rev_8_21_14_0_20_64_10]